MPMNSEGPNPLRIKALAFDVFGTVVDWRGSIIREGTRWGQSKDLHVDWARFADRWREGYSPMMDKVRKGALPWMKLDALHRLILDDLLKEFKINGLTEEEKDDWNRVWHRLSPWSDAVEGLMLLKKKFVLATLSNGNVSLLVEMAKFAGLPWDTVLSAELFRHYKPDREVYLGTADLLGCQPAELGWGSHERNFPRDGRKRLPVPMVLRFGQYQILDVIQISHFFRHLGADETFGLMLRGLGAGTSIV